MNKFTIFTVILAVSVITVTVDLGLRDYFDKNSEASVLMEDDTEDSEQKNEREANSSNSASISDSVVMSDSSGESTLNPQPSILNPQVYTPPPPASSIVQAKISEAGFTGQLAEKQFNGRVFQLLDITKNPVDAMSFYEITENGAPAVSITEIVLRDEIRALQLYVLLQNKTKPYIDLTLNETNAYGDRSFYINHAKKTDEAFLTVKIGNRLYAFAYVKAYHSSIKKFIQLLTS
ncbi:hypothetical protein HYW83_00400 [Candidatus Peregrinibacteria bacterium]|nr:hypothetical protein [Candidatus Peregrinibacteria bacterium]